MSRQDGPLPPSLTPAEPPERPPFHVSSGLPVADLVPEGNLSRVPPGDPCREKPFHVSQEHDPVHSVVFAVCLLAGTERAGEPGPRTLGNCGGLNGAPKS